MSLPRRLRITQELARVELDAALLIEAQTAGWRLETRREHAGVRALASHAVAEPGIVQATAARIAHQVQHAIRTRWVVLAEPLLEEVARARAAGAAA